MPQFFLLEILGRFFHLVPIHHLPFVRSEADARGLNKSVKSWRVRAFRRNHLNVLGLPLLLREGSQHVMKRLRADSGVRRNHRGIVWSCVMRKAVARLVCVMFSWGMVDVLRGVHWLLIDGNCVDLLLDYIGDADLVGNFIRLQHFDFLHNWNFYDLDFWNLLGVVLVNRMVRILGFDVSENIKKLSKSLGKLGKVSVCLHMMVTSSAPTLNWSNPRCTHEQKNLQEVSN